MNSFFNKNKNLVIGIFSFAFLAILIGGIFLFQSFQNSTSKASSDSRNSQTSLFNSLNNTSNTMVNQNGQNSSDQSLNGQGKSFSGINPSISTASNSNSQTQILSAKSSNNDFNSDEPNCSVTPTPTTNNKLQVYTNPNYPNLKINYDDSWKITKESRPFWNSSLCEGKITLSKGNTKLEFILVPGFTVGGLAGDYKIAKVEIDKMTRIIYTDSSGKFLENMENNYYYVKTKSLGDGENWNNSTTIKTNISYNNLSEKDKKRFSGVPSNKLIIDDNLHYLATINLKSSNPSEINQADEIIRNSVFE